MSDQPSDKKIIVDEDWKSRVQAEKEALAKEQQEKPADAPPGAAAMPEASFPMLISTMVTEAMVGLGQIPLPGSETPKVELSQAKYFIDMLAVIEEKTRGNLTPAEKQSLEDVIHQLRLAYVSVQSQQAAAGPSKAT